MAKYSDYVQEGNEPKVNDPEVVVTPVEPVVEITPDPQPINWEDRYKELEKHNSRQAQELGDYRKVIDTYITDPTPEPESVKPPEIDPGKLYDNPAEVFDEQIAAHPAVQRVEKLEQQLLERERDLARAGFETAHPDWNATSATPEFANWVQESQTRLALAQRADQFDFDSADALFSLYEAETQSNTQATEQAQEQNVQAVSLETPAAGEPPAPQAFSRSEMTAMKTRAKQGDLEAESYVRANAAAYLQALADKNVRP